MSDYIIKLLDLTTWELIFSVCFFLGLFFTIYIIFGALNSGDSHEGDHDLDGDHDLGGDHDFDVDHDLGGDHDFDLDADHDLSIDADHDLSMDVDHDLSMDADHDFDLDADHDLNLDGDHDLGGDHDFDADHDMSMDADHDLSLDDLQIDDIHDVGTIRDSSYTLKTNFMMGNISVFLLFWGQTGWLYINELSDLTLFFSILVGILSSKAFAFFLSKYAKTVVVPLVKIQKGDIAQVINAVSPSTAGRVHVRRRDGIMDPVMAKGAYPHDTFGRGEKGYIMGKTSSLYLITKGAGEPQLKKQKKKKALDTLQN